MQVRRLVLVLASVAFAVAAPLAAGAAASSSGVNPTTGTFAGAVVDSDGQPLAGICVDLWQGQTNEAPSGVSDAHGNYTIGSVAPGTYLLVYFSCSAEPNVQPQFYGNTQSSAQSPQQTIAAGETRQLDQQQMKPGGEISLRLADTSTNPVVGLHVRATLQESDGPDIEGWVPGPWDRTDATGSVVFKGLLPLHYSLDYESCPEIFCAIVGYYQGKPWYTPLMTLVQPVAGQVLDLSDVIDVPPVVASHISLVASPSTVTQGQPVTLTANVTDVDGSTAQGGVYFWARSGGSSMDVDWAQLDGDGQATVTTSQLPVGSWTVYVYYYGYQLVAPSESGVSLAVNAPTSDGGGAGGGGGGGGAPPVSSPVSGSVPAGGSLWSDPAGTSPDASNPLVLGVTSPNGGAVLIDKTAPDTQVAHYRVLNVGATITAPAASVADPLRLSFEVFDGSLPDGAYASDLTVFRDGSPVAGCAKPGVVSPDPCVTSSATANGVTTINVLSSHASTWDVEAAQVGRVAGADRVATAAAVALDSFPNGGAGAVVLARADDFPDALVGAPLAAARSAPLLLTQGASLPEATVDALSKVLAKGGTVYVLGGSKAVPESVATQLSTLGYQVTRYAGADRYATAVTVADALGDPSTVLLATGANFPDALAAGPAAAHVTGAVLLTEGASLPQATSAYLAAHPGTTYAVGGPAAKADPNATAIAGVDRYATAAALAARFFAAPTLVGVATGTSFPDALSGGAQLARAGGPLLLATPTAVPAPTSGYLAGVKTGLTAVHLFGGPNALTDNVTTQLKNAL